MFASYLRRNVAVAARNLTANYTVRMKSAQTMPENATDVVQYKTLSITVPKPFVFHIELNRPKRYNAINTEMWSEIKSCFESLSTNPDCRAIVLSASGKHFTAGIELTDLMQMGQDLNEMYDVARKGIYLERLIKVCQDSMSSLENCPKPVITAIHSACIGAGVDMITAADIRYCTQDAFFSVKEVEIGMAADVGTLQRFPKVISSQSLARELCFTGRRFDSSEALSSGLISRVFPDKDSLLTGAMELAENIAEKSPIAVQTTKQSMIYSQNRPNQDGLDRIREMNKLYLQSEDFAQAAAAQLTKGEKPVFSKL